MQNQACSLHKKREPKLRKNKKRIKQSSSSNHLSLTGFLRSGIVAFCNAALEKLHGSGDGKFDDPRIWCRNGQGLIIVLYVLAFTCSKKQPSLVFRSVASVSLFKQESACQDFYVDRDALAVAGFFTEEQTRLALTKYEAKSGTLAE